MQRLVIIIFVILALPSTAFAMSSSSYTIPQYSIGQASGQSSSRSFQLDAQVAPLGGSLASSSYALDAGFPSETGGSITLSLDHTTVSFGDLAPNTPATATVTATVTTTSINGYRLMLDAGSGLVRTGGSEVIGPIAASVASPAAWSGTGFGFSIASGTALESKWNSGAAYAAVPGQLTTVHQVAQALTGSDSTQVQFKASVGDTQRPGTYTATAGLLATVLP